MQPPPLPASWPYAPRPAPAPPERREGIELPGLPGTWQLEAVPGLRLGPAEPAMGRAFGRGGVFRAGDAVLRPYRRGGLVRHVNAAVYLTPARFLQEFQVHRALWSAGLPTVEPLGWACRRRLWGWEGVYLTRFAEGTPWPRAWDSPQAVPGLRTLLGALCAWGLQAPDLNATNVLVLPGDGILALDWDRAAWTGRTDLAERYRERLLRSLAKLGAPEALRRQF
jgi:hypothetical protein